MPLFKAPLIYTSSDHGVMQDHIIRTDDRGTILTVDHASRFNITDEKPVETNGIIIPGMINAHCHLELSHMKGMIPTGTGLVEFIRQIITRRNADMHSIKQAVTRAVHEMKIKGIVAVGDISNVTDSFEEKEKGELYFHSFIEAFDLMQYDKTLSEYEKSKKVYDALDASEKNKKAIVPHAPYSVSDPLFKLIFDHRDSSVSTSIHHQETEAENQFISGRVGALVDFFEGFGLSLESYQAQGRLASSRVIDHMASDQKTLLVHNTMSTENDIRNIESWNQQAYWVTCPNANLYIENRLPVYQNWLQQNAKICIGTDSLASNWQLSILEEMITIHKYQSSVPTSELIRWATINGAHALGFEHSLGSIEVGKTPGLVAIEGFDLEKNRFERGNMAKRLI